MSVEENRNCNCNDNMATGTYMNKKNNDNEEMMNNNNREEMLHQIMAYDFAINELALYLDTHNDDEKALCLHNRYCKIVKDLKDKYQKVYGPLTIEYPCNKWRWIEEPWPSFSLGETAYLKKYLKI